MAAGLTRDVVHIRVAGTRLARRVCGSGMVSRWVAAGSAIRLAVEKTMSHQRRGYTVDQLIHELSIPRRTFFQLKNAGKLPFLEELRPGIGQSVRYRAEPIERYLANGWAACRQHPRKTR